MFGGGRDARKRGVDVALFLSRFDNKVDRKGRVSVPAPYRTALAGQAFAGIVAYPSLVSQAIDACDMARIEELANGIDSFNPFSEEYSAFATAILSRSHQLQFDGEGRVVLPEPLIRHAGITEVATFAGQGATFQIWSPERYEVYEPEATEQAKEQAAKFALSRHKGADE
ncbi:MAG: transcriptional regulator MraZ [Alphaproteobacteria bacterium]|jgi:MraZ protein|nr:transcriptional regulator MraZ [Alphaproteobacteria bacterium]